MSLGEFYKNAEKIIVNDLITYHYKKNDNDNVSVLNLYFSKKSLLTEKPFAIDCLNKKSMDSGLCYVDMIDLSIDDDPKNFFNNMQDYSKSLDGKTFDIVNCRFSIKSFMTSVRDLLIFIKFVSDLLNDRGVFIGFLLDLSKLNGIFTEMPSMYAGPYGIEYANQNDISDNLTSMTILINGEKMNIMDFSTLEMICKKCNLIHLDNIILESLYNNSLSNISLTENEKQFGFLNYMFIFQKITY
jgi:hypothetical protein